MPPFSGKQKKAYLQEKRARKKDKRPLGADTTSSDSDASDGAEATATAAAAHHHGNAPHSARGGRGSSRGAGGRGGDRGRGGRGGRGGDASNNKDASNAATDVYGGDKKGVRSEFQKEHRREVKERQQANYAPLLERDFTDAEKGGIPFGKWFRVANLAERRQGLRTEITNVNGDEKVLMGEGGYSSTFLYSIALPRRARMSGEDGTDIFADPADDSDDNGQGPMRGPRRGGVGRSTGRGRGGRKSHLGEFTDTTTTSDDSDNDGAGKNRRKGGTQRSSSSSSSSSSKKSSSDGDAEAEEEEEEGVAVGDVANTGTKAGLKSLKERLKAATAYDARERHVFRHWMNRIDAAFGTAPDASGRRHRRGEAPPAQAPAAEEDQPSDSEEEEGEGEKEAPLKKERRIGRRHRAVDNANDPSRKAKPATQPHPLATLELNLFERNIDVWRQLWRTVENSDVVAVVADGRYPIVHLPISLFRHVMGECGKPIVVILNKADLMTEAALAGWESFLRAYWAATLKPRLPAEARHLVDEIAICRFTCSPEAGTALAAGGERATSRRKKKAPRNAKLYEELKAGESRKGHSIYAPSRKELKGKLFDYAGEAKRAKKAEGGTSSDDSDSDKSDNDANGAALRAELAIVKKMIDDVLVACRRKGHGIANADTTTPLPPIGEAVRPIHVGFVGHPNVGKSSLINCIRGSKAVSVSATAGHTKHLQTVPLLADGVVLIDCPGLAFPVLGLPRPMQAVLGTHQIAQTRDPQSGIGYLAARLCLERIYGLRKLGHSGPIDDEEPWSAYELCEAFGHKKGFHVKKGKGAIDVHRAAIALLKEAYEGRLVLAFAPPPAAYLTSTAFATVSRYLYLDPEHLSNDGEGLQ